MGAFSSGTLEGTRVDFRIALGGVANRSAARYVVEGTTVGRSARPVRTDRSPDDWRFLHRGNDRDVLQTNGRNVLSQNLSRLISLSAAQQFLAQRI